MKRKWAAALLALVAPAGLAQVCNEDGVRLQVLGSGGPDLVAGRASSSYLVWIDGKARVLVDIGGGAGLRFAESGARATDLDVVLFTHLHIDHTTDLPALVKSAWLDERDRTLPLYGPGGNRIMPSTVTFVRELFDPTRGVYRYLGSVVSPLTREPFKLQPHDVRGTHSRSGTPPGREEVITEVFANERLRTLAASAPHGQVPALAWRVEASGKIIVFSGDTNGNGDSLEQLAQSADVLIAHHAVPEAATGMERALHMPPSVIGLAAGRAKAKQLVLSHRMRRTLGREEESLEKIRQHYSGPVSFANDLDCFRP